MAGRRRKRTQFWVGHTLIVAVIVIGVTAVNQACARAHWPALEADVVRVAFLVIVLMAIAVSFSGKGPEGRA